MKCSTWISDLTFFFEFLPVAPVLSFAVTPRTINESQNATVECTVTAANPATNITVRISRENSATVSHVGGIAELVHVTRDQAGTYTCTASNSVGSVSTASSTLTVNRMLLLRFPFLYFKEIIDESPSDFLCLSINLRLF